MPPAIQNLLEPLSPVMDILSAHPYIALFAGMLIAGEIILLPAIFLATTGRIDLLAVVSISLLATLISDAIWYALGRRFPARFIKRFSGRFGHKFLDSMERIFNAGGGQVLFLSKFVYGTRTLVQVFAGLHGMPFRNYLPINMAGVLAVIVVLILVSYAIVGMTIRIEEVMQRLQVAFLLFVVITVGGFFMFSRVMKQRWSV